MRRCGDAVNATIRDLASVRAALLRWHRRNGLRAPWRESGDPYKVLVAAVMAQQTQMSRVLEVYERFLRRFPDVESLARASRGDVIRAWAGMGYNQRAIRLHEAARAVASAGWPRDAAALERLPGIGPFTAAIIASFAFGKPAACVDTNVRRVLGRLAGDETMPAAAMQRLADAAMSRRSPARWNQALMDFGARICTPRPKCNECIVARWCASRERYAAPRVAERRRHYVARRQPAYEGSSRWWRGRIIDALRALAPGAGVSFGVLRRTISANGALSVAEMRALVGSLEREGLAEFRDGQVSLPE